MKDTGVGPFILVLAEICMNGKNTLKIKLSPHVPFKRVGFLKPIMWLMTSSDSNLTFSQKSIYPNNVLLHFIGSKRIDETITKMYISI